MTEASDPLARTIDELFTNIIEEIEATREPPGAIDEELETVVEEV